jgi:hypothetical protein
MYRYRIYALAHFDVVVSFVALTVSNYNVNHPGNEYTVRWDRVEN